MKTIAKFAVGAVLLAGASFAGAAPAAAGTSVGISFGFGPGYGYYGPDYDDAYGPSYYGNSCDYYDYYNVPPPWGLPPGYCGYQVYYGPVYWGDTWYRGPIYYRGDGDDRLYWLNGGWRHNEWHHNYRPNIEWRDRGYGHWRGGYTGGTHWDHRSYGGRLHDRNYGGQPHDRNYGGGVHDRNYGGEPFRGIGLRPFDAGHRDSFTGGGGGHDHDPPPDRGTRGGPVCRPPDASSGARATRVPVLVRLDRKPVGARPDGLAVPELYIDPADRARRGGQPERFVPLRGALTAPAPRADPGAGQGAGHVDLTGAQQRHVLESDLAGGEGGEGGRPNRALYGGACVGREGLGTPRGGAARHARARDRQRAGAPVAGRGREP